MSDMSPYQEPIDSVLSSNTLIQTDPTSADVSSLSSGSQYPSLPVRKSESDHKQVVDNVEKETLPVSSPPIVYLEEEASLALTTKPQQARRIIRFPWLEEIIACSLSLVCAFAVSMLLLYNHGMELDNWSQSISPNAVVSSIGSLTTISTIIVLSGILNRLKWIYFKVANPLEHLRIFHRASHGPLSSFLWVRSSKGCLASVTVVLMFCSLFVSPFLQSALSFQDVLKIDLSQPSHYLQSNIYNPDIKHKDTIARYHGEAHYAMYSTATREMIKAIDHGLSNDEQFMNTTCPTGHCIWPDPIEMLGVCGRCDDLTATIERSCSTTVPLWQDKQPYNGPKWMMIQQSDGSTFPMRMRPGANRNINVTCRYYFENLNLSRPTLTVSAGGTVDDDGNLQNMTKAIWNSTADNSVKNRTGDRAYITRFHALQSPAAIADVKAWTCHLFWCHKILPNVTVSKGNREFITAKESFLYYGSNRGSLRGLYPKHGQIGTDGSFFMNERASDLLANQLDLTFSVAYGSRKALQLDGSSKDILEGYTSTISEATRSLDLNRTISKLASSLTDMVRQDRNGTAVPGETMVTKTVIQIYWPWLLLPISLPVLTSILLAVVAVRSNRKDVAPWEDDMLEVLSQRLDNVDLTLSNDRKAVRNETGNISTESTVELSSSNCSHW